MGIISTVIGKLRRLGVLESFTNDEVLDAFTEDKLREHDEAVRQIRSMTAVRKFHNNQLRCKLERAKMSPVFAEFEEAIRKEHHQNAR